MSSQERHDVVILGAGVVGLSIALELSNAGYKVVVVGKDLPEDINSAGFASPWAGCNWRPFETDGQSQEAKRDTVTFKRLAELSRKRPDLCRRIPFLEVFPERMPKEDVWFAQVVGDYSEVQGTPDNPLAEGYQHGHSYSSYIIHAPNYLQYLRDELIRSKVPILRARLSALDQAYNLTEVGPVNLVVNATGLGSSTLIGVEDKQVYPARGQTVLVRAPKVQRCTMGIANFTAGDKAGTSAYIIPRPGTDGHVVLGGTYFEEHSVLPDLDEAARILRDCHRLDPNLAPNGSWGDIEVISHNVGLRPSRHGGARVEYETRTLGQDRNPLIPRTAARQFAGKRVGIIHAYGFGGYGYIASLGTAEEVLGLVRKHQKGAKL